MESGESGADSGAGVVWEDEAEDREREDHHEESVGTVEIVGLLVMPDSSEEKGDAHEPVHHEHDHGEHGIASEGGFGFAARHDEADDGDFKASDGEGEEEGAEGFTEAVSDEFGVFDDGDSGVEADGPDHDDQGGEKEGVVVSVGDFIVAEEGEGEGEDEEVEGPFL